jgi:hypothetical protein
MDARPCSAPAFGPALDGHNRPAMLVKQANMRIAFVCEIASIVVAAVLLLSPMETRAHSAAPAKADTHLPVEDLPPLVQRQP